MKVSQSHLEKPATSQEKEISKIIVKVLEFIKEGDFAGLAPLYVSQNGGKFFPVKKNEYIENIRKNFSSTQEFGFDEIAIRVKDSSSATAFFLRRIKRFGNLLPEVSRRTMKFVKYDDSWHILYDK